METVKEKNLEPQKNKGEKQGIAKIAMLTATIIWGSSFIIVKDITDVWPSGFLLAVRFTIACLLLAAVFYKRLHLIDKQYLKSGVVIGFMLFMAYYTQTIGITDTTPGKNAFLTAFYCVLVPFMFWLVDKKRPDIYNIMAAFICILGIGLVSLTQKFTIGFGDSLTLVGAVFYAAHIVCVAKLARDKDPWLITVLQFGVAAILSWVVTIAAEPAPTDFSMGVWGGALYLAVLCTAVALSFQNFGQKYTHPSAAAIILSLESVFGVIFSVIFYHEVLTAKIVAGFVLIFVSVLISETKLSFLPFGKK